MQHSPMHSSVRRAAYGGAACGTQCTALANLTAWLRTHPADMQSGKLAKQSALAPSSSSTATSTALLLHTTPPRALAGHSLTPYPPPPTSPASSSCPGTPGKSVRPLLPPPPPRLIDLRLSAGPPLPARRSPACRTPLVPLAPSRPNNKTNETRTWGAARLAFRALSKKVVVVW